MRNLRRIPAGMLLIAALAALAWASDPWKAKPYHAWDKKDVGKILNDSPWAQTATVEAQWRAGAMTSNPVMTSQGSSSVAGGGAMGGPSGLGMQPHVQTARFVARWTSALTTREAIARMAVLDGEMTQADADRDLGRAPADYQITLLGDDMTPFAALDETALAKASYIEMKKSKRKVAPSSVQIERSADRGSVLRVAFNFPRSENGQQTIAADEKAIDFLCKVKGADLQFHFDLQKMTGPRGRDL